jgi:hypothetical protein
MPIDPTLAFPGVFANNPGLANMVDKAANKLTTKSGGGPTATATATATAGGATATATASTAGLDAQDAILMLAQQAIDAAMGRNSGGLGNLPGGAVGSFTTGLVEGLATGLSGSYSPSSPSPTDCFPPCPPGVQPSMLNVDSSGVITTAGGYKVQATSQFEWTITGPDGTKSRIWGDPHVDAHGTKGDFKFDFKKDTKFVLPDGTEINVKCTPWQGNPNVTVTQSLEIIQGNDRVFVTDIDKGKGKAGAVKHEAVAAQDTFKTEQTLIGGSAGDWYAHEALVTGNIDGTPDTWTYGYNAITDVMDGFLGGWQNQKAGSIGEAAWEIGGMGQKYDSAQLTAVLQRHGQLAKNGQLDNVLNQVLGILPKLLQAITALVQLRSYNPYNPTQQQPPVQKPVEKPKPPVYDPNQHARGLREAFNAIGAMFIALGNMIQLMASFKPNQAVPVGAR